MLVGRIVSEVFFTVILHEASTFLIFAVILQVPAFFAVISPYVFTEAIEEELLLNVGSFPLEATAIRPNSSPIAIVFEYLVSTITGGSCKEAALTVIRVNGENRNRIVNNTMDNIEYLDLRVIGGTSLSSWTFTEVSGTPNR